MTAPLMLPEPRWWRRKTPRQQEILARAAARHYERLRAREVDPQVFLPAAAPPASAWPDPIDSITAAALSVFAHLTYRFGSKFPGDDGSEIDWPWSSPRRYVETPNGYYEVIEDE